MNGQHHMARETLADLRDQLALAQGQLRLARQPITDFTDERLVPFLEKANEVASENGYCDTYEEILDEIGAPVLKKEWDVTVTMRVSARTAGHAETALDEVLGNMDTEIVTYFVPTSTSDFTLHEN